jgi:hypothetical protein
VRFFTRRSIQRELRQAGFKTVRTHVTGLPLEVLSRGTGGLGGGAVRLLDRAAVAIRPTLFGYQLLYHCETSAAPVLIDEPPPARERDGPAGH